MFFAEHEGDSARAHISGRREAEMLLRSALDLEQRDFILLDREARASAKLEVDYGELLARRIGHEPIQYILGDAAFCELDLAVGPGVLIPRPETEILVERVSHFLSQSRGDSGMLLDVGTGTGAIGLTLLSRFPNWFGIGFDLSAAALFYAKENARAFGEGRFLPAQGDLLQAVRMGAGYVDLIVSNPPYIPSRELDGLLPEVKDREPRLALDGGGDGLSVTLKLLPAAKSILRSGGLLAFELALDQPQIVALQAKEMGFDVLEVYRDLTGRERGVVLRLSA